MGIDHYAYMIYGLVKDYDESFFQSYTENGDNDNDLPVVFDPMYGQMHLGIILFQSGSIEDSADDVKNMVVDPENVTALLEMRDRYKSAFAETFPEHKSLVDGKWRIRTFVFMCA